MTREDTLTVRLDPADHVHSHNLEFRNTGHAHQFSADLRPAAPVAEDAREIYQMLLRVASGERTKSELQGLGDHEFVPWQIGAVR